jgi:pimeloyl-ACP methyl ester carboxylesterase
MIPKLNISPPPMISCHTLSTPSSLPLFYTGPGLEEGPLPAFFYFSLSGEESLCLDPYNQPVAFLHDAPLRVFSWNLPGHGPGYNPHTAVALWAHEIRQGRRLIADFVEEMLKTIQHLIDQHIVDPEKMAVGGLSRGAFIASHLAAKEPRLKTLLGFAPLTDLTRAQEFKELHSIDLASLSLQALANHLIHTHVRFYIGNHDTRVGTDACFAFIDKLSQAAFAHRIRSPQVELFITPSVGHKGHGTLPRIFFDGANWIREHLC